MFGDIIHRKTGFLHNKNIDCKSRKNCFFAKGLVHSFGQKFEIFPSFHFSKIGKKKVLVDILYRKKVFLDKKKITLKYVKKYCIFPKRLVRGFRQKFEIFQSFYFIKKRQGKCVSRYSPSKNSLSRQ